MKRTNQFVVACLLNAPLRLQVAPLAAASGAEDGVVRLWDLMTGACVHKLRGHSATVTSVICTTLYVISVGMDDQLCVWERCKGYLLHYIPSVSNQIGAASPPLNIHPCHSTGEEQTYKKCGESAGK